MSNDPVERVVAMLRNAGYVPRSSPMRVASVDFDFAAILTGGHSLDLVVVVDTLSESSDRFQRKLENLSRALDLVSSRRPITAVLVGPPPRTAAMDGLMRTGRVLVIDSPVGADADGMIQDAIAVLLPLELPKLDDTTTQSWDDMRAGLEATHEVELIGPLLDQAEIDGTAVRQQLRTWLSQPLTEGTE